MRQSTPRLSGGGEAPPRYRTSSDIASALGHLTNADGTGFVAEDPPAHLCRGIRSVAYAAAFSRSDAAGPEARRRALVRRRGRRLRRGILRRCEAPAPFHLLPGCLRAAAAARRNLAACAWLSRGQSVRRIVPAPGRWLLPSISAP